MSTRNSQHQHPIAATLILPADRLLLQAFTPIVDKTHTTLSIKLVRVRALSNARKGLFLIAVCHSDDNFKAASSPKDETSSPASSYGTHKSPSQHPREGHIPGWKTGEGGPGAPGTAHQAATRRGDPRFAPRSLCSRTPASGSASQPQAGNQPPHWRVWPHRSLPAPPARVQCPFPPWASHRPGGRHTEPAARQPQRRQPAVAAAPRSSPSTRSPHLSAAARLKVEPGHPPPARRRLSGKLR